MKKEEETKERDLSRYEWDKELYIESIKIFAEVKWRDQNNKNWVKNIWGCDILIVHAIVMQHAVVLSMISTWNPRSLCPKSCSLKKFMEPSNYYFIYGEYYFLAIFKSKGALYAWQWRRRQPHGWFEWIRACILLKIKTKNWCFVY